MCAHEWRIPRESPLLLWRVATDLIYRRFLVSITSVLEQDRHRRFVLTGQSLA